MSQVRPATHDDIPGLVELRAIMYADTDRDWGTPVQGWRESCAAALAEQLTNPNMRFVVTDTPTGLAACGMAAIDERLPGPYNLSGRSGHIFTIVTDPAYRRQGHGRAIMAALLAWFDARGLARVDLMATPDGQDLYRAFGFTDHPDQPMRRIHQPADNPSR